MGEIEVEFLLTKRMGFQQGRFRSSLNSLKLEVGFEWILIRGGRDCRDSSAGGILMGWVGLGWVEFFKPQQDVIGR